jgi:Recombinase
MRKIAAIGDSTHLKLQKDADDQAPKLASRPLHREALAAKKASGVRLGQPPIVPRLVIRRIQRQRARGESLRPIAESLNQDKVPPAQGGKEWYAATVRHVLLRTS